MKKTIALFAVLMLLHSLTFSQLNNTNAPSVKTINGTLEGLDESGIYTFKGIPFAAPPVGNFRWREPQPVKDWTGVRKATKFGPRAMQLPVFGDMSFRSDGMSEDCLYLNVWTPAKTGTEKLPVLVYFYGGGFIAGDGSELRYDGESLARHGIVTITVNYRLGVFGFMSHAELTKESPHHASGNYGLLDQAAALKWVQQNIASFGGDPKKITIAGESAGSFSVSAQMASPLSKNIIAGAIGESGSLLGLTPTATLAEAEKAGEGFATSIKANTLADLRALNADSLLKATATAGYGRFPVDVDGYFFTKSPVAVFEAGEQAHVPLLVGWNSEEMNYRMLMGQDALNKENFTNAVKKRYNDKADDVLKLYNASNDEELEQAATDLSSDMFIGFSTWKWSYLQSKTGGKPVYRYRYSRARPGMRAEMGNATANLAGGVTKDTTGKAPKAALPKGAVHSAEIEYALGNLPTNTTYDWQADDYAVSGIMEAMFANFIKTGNPNGLGVPEWKPVVNGKPADVMVINVDSKTVAATNDARYEFMNNNIKK